jgi:sarcosine oxidase subunit beta
VVTLAHDRNELELFRRRCNAMQLLDIDGDILSRDELALAYPRLNLSSAARYPVVGGLLHRQGGISRHDAVAWGYARAASALGVDIIQNCAVTDIDVSNRSVRGVVTSRGRVRADKVAIAVAGHSSEVAAMAGVSLPVTSQCLQAMVSEPVKPCLDGVVISLKVHCYVSQSDRGELVIGGGTDAYTSYAQRGNFSSTRDTIRSTLELFPSFDRLKLMRQWGGIVDISPDSSPIISKTDVAGLYISGGWGTGGYKAIPAGGECFAHTIAHDRPHTLSEPFSLHRFQTGHLIDESLSASVAH